MLEDLAAYKFILVRNITEDAKLPPTLKMIIFYDHRVA